MMVSLSVVGSSSESASRSHEDYARCQDLNECPVLNVP